MELLPATPDTLPRAIAVLRAGGVVAHPTETCYGLACDLTNPLAVERVFAIKHRARTQPVSGLFATVDEARRYVEWPDEAAALAAAHLPGPLTLILPLRADAPMRLFPIPQGAPTIGVRVSSLPLAQQLARESGVPLSTTSANVHGEENPYSAASIAERFARESFQPDLILDAGELPRVPPSTVVDLATGTGVRRAGDIAVR